MLQDIIQQKVTVTENGKTRLFRADGIRNNYLVEAKEGAMGFWRNPLTWPWARVLWAYGFTIVGVALTAGVGLMLWTFVIPSPSSKPPTARIETSQSYTIAR